MEKEKNKPKAKHEKGTVEKKHGSKASKKEAQPPEKKETEKETAKAKEIVKEKGVEKKPAGAKEKAANKAMKGKKKAEETAKEKEPKQPKKAFEKKPLDLEAEKLREQIRKKRLPVFRGRFGKKWLRRKSIKKWQKWRYPRGIDISLRKEDGALPATGYRSPKKIRGLHPSGFEEGMVRNLAEISAFPKEKAARIQRTLGKKARKQIFLKAKELGIKVLNR